MCLAVPGEFRVRRRTQQLGQLGGVGTEQWFGADMGLWSVRAVPVQVVAARAPRGSAVLGDRDLEVLGTVRAFDVAVGAPQWQLPTHVRFGLQRLPAASQCVGMQRASGPTAEARTVQEDTRAID